MKNIMEDEKESKKEAEETLNENSESNFSREKKVEAEESEPKQTEIGSTVAENLQKSDSEENLKKESVEDDETRQILEHTAIQTNTVEKETIKEIGISEEIISEKFKTALETQKPKTKKKNAILTFVMLALNIILITFISKNLFSNLEDGSIVTLFKTQGDKMWWLGGGVLAYFFYMLIQVLMYRVLIKNLSGRKSWKIAYDTAVVGKYYDSITPFTFGGQSMQILRLTSNGIGAGVATSIPILKIMITSGVNAFMALIFFVFGIPLIPKSTILNDILVLLLEIVGVIGLIITILIAVFIILISNGTIVTKTIISGLLRLGYKLRIIKDYRTTYKKVMNQVTEYKFSMGYLWRHKKILIQLCFFSVLECLVYASLVFFVAMAFAQNIETSVFMFLVLCIAKYYLSSMASVVIPLPGGTGLMEISFYLLFSMTLGGNIAWALLIWRFLSYYSIILHGFLHEIIKIGSNLVKSRKKEVTR